MFQTTDPFVVRLTDVYFPGFLLLFELFEAAFDACLESCKALAHGLQLIVREQREKLKYLVALLIAAHFLGNEGCESADYLSFLRVLIIVFLDAVDHLKLDQLLKFRRLGHRVDYLLCCRLNELSLELVKRAREILYQVFLSLLPEQIHDSLPSPLLAVKLKDLVELALEALIKVAWALKCLIFARTLFDQSLGL